MNSPVEHRPMPGPWHCIRLGADWYQVVNRLLQMLPPLFPVLPRDLAVFHLLSPYDSDIIYLNPASGRFIEEQFPKLLPHYKAERCERPDPDGLKAIYPSNNAEVYLLNFGRERVPTYRRDD